MAGIGEAIYTALEIFIAIACCSGNVLVIWAVQISGGLRKPIFCFIMSLAVADFLLGAVAIPLSVVLDGRFETSFQGCLFISCVVIVLTQASVNSLLAIAVDRYLRVHIPLSYKGKVKLMHSGAIVVVCWVTAAVLGCVPMFGWNNYGSVTPSNSTTIVCQFLTVIPMSYLVKFSFFSCFLPPLIIMTVLYYCIFYTIYKHLRGGIAKASNSSAYYVKEQKLAISLALVLILFAACCLPIHIMNIIEFYGQGSRVPHVAFYIGLLLSHTNSAVNPVVYAFKIPKMKEAYQIVLRKVLPCQTEKQKNDSSQMTELGNNEANIIAKSGSVLT